MHCIIPIDEYTGRRITLVENLMKAELLKQGIKDVEILVYSDRNKYIHFYSFTHIGQNGLPIYDPSEKVTKIRVNKDFIYTDLETIIDSTEPLTTSRPYIIDDANTLLQSLKKQGLSLKEVSDGYHTFQELYDMRLALTVCCFNNIHNAAQWSQLNANNHRPLEKQLLFSNPVWRSRLHSDGTMFEDMFIVGCFNQAGSMITFHYKNEHWYKFHFCEILDRAPEWDGHTDKDVINRLLKL